MVMGPINSSNNNAPDGGVHGPADPNKYERWKKCKGGCAEKHPEGYAIEGGGVMGTVKDVIRIAFGAGQPSPEDYADAVAWTECVNSCNAAHGLTSADNMTDTTVERILEIDSVAAAGIIESTKAKDAAVEQLINENGTGCAQELKMAQEAMKLQLDQLRESLKSAGLKHLNEWFTVRAASPLAAANRYQHISQTRDDNTGQVVSANGPGGNYVSTLSLNAGIMSDLSPEARSQPALDAIFDALSVDFFKWDNPNTQATPSTAVYYNIENILLSPTNPLVISLEEQLASWDSAVHFANKTGDRPSYVDNWPWGWEAWIGAYIQQVQYVVDNTIPEDAIVQSQQYLETGGSDSAWQQLKAASTGTGDSDRNSASGAHAGSIAGVLAAGAPVYWPLNKRRTGQHGTGENSESSLVIGSSPQGGLRSTDYYASVDQTGGADSAMFSLQNWASAALQMITAMENNVDGQLAPGAPYILSALRSFITQTSNLAAKASAAAGCMLEAFGAADDAMNDASEALDDLGLTLGDWQRSDQHQIVKDAIDAAKARARQAYDRAEGIELLRPEKILFKEQCFLLSFVSLIAEYKKNFLDHATPSKARSPRGNHKRLPYSTVKNAAPKAKLARATNASLLIDGDPYGFLNKLIYSPFQQRLLDIENFELSSIQPKIRLFKVIYDSNGEEREVEITFDSHYTNEDLNVFTKSKGNRGVGAGLKYFNFTYDGSNPFSAKKSIKAKLGIFANNFNELLRDRSGPINKLLPKDNKFVVVPAGTQKYSYVELALKTAKPHRVGDCKPNQDYLDMLQENEELSKLNFRLKAVVGLSAPNGLNGMKASDKARIQQALQDSHITLNLTPTIHDFAFDEQGRVNFTIEYLAYVEEYFDQKGFNVFADPTGEVGFRAVKRQLQMTTYQRDCGGGSPAPATPPNTDSEEGEAPPPTAAEHLASIKEKFAREIEQDQLASVSKLLNTMACSNLIYYVNVPPNAVKRFIQLGPFADYDEYVDRYKGGDFISEDASAATIMADQIEQALPEAAEKTQEDQELSADGADASFNHVASAMVGLDPNANNIAFFYISDLIDTVLANIQAEIEELPLLLASGFPTSASRTGRQAMDNSVPLSVGFDPIPDTTACEIREKIRKYKQYKTDFKRMRVLLGPVEVVYQKPTEGLMSTFVNLGDIPISVKYFVEWLTTKVLQREENHYPLAKFLNDLFNNLVREFLNNDSCFVYNIAQKIHVNQATITGHTGLDNPHEDRVTKAIKGLKGSRSSRINLKDFGEPNFCSQTTSGKIDYKNLPIICISGTPEGAVTYPTIETEMNYFVYFAGRTMPTERQNGIKCEDQSRGIQHYLLGRDKGMVKNIKLSKTQTPGLSEVRFEQDGYDGLRQLRNVYDVQIESFASVQTFPGTYIYVPPAGFDPSIASRVGQGFDLTDLGIGGYCMVVRSEHEFGEGYANSTIHAKWVASLEDEHAGNNHNGRSDDVRGATGKCGIYAKRHSAAKGGA